MRPKLTKACPECGSENVLYDADHDRLICNDCAAIFAELPPALEREFEHVARRKAPRKHGK